MIVIIVALVLLLIFSVLTYFFTKTWRWPHVTAAFLCFTMAMVMVMMSAMVLRTQSAWKSLYESNKERLDEAIETGNHLALGDSMEVDQSQPSVRSATGKLTRALFDRGRVWRMCFPTNIAAGQVTLNTTPPGTEKAVQNGIHSDIVLYAFKNVQIPNSNVWMPGIYLGEFKVTAATDDSVTMAPTIPLDQVQAAAANQADVPWTLYEMMPVDSHHAFSRAEDAYQPLDNTETQPVFGEMDAQLLQQIFGATMAQTRPQLSPEQQNQVLQTMLQPYLRDGTRADAQMDEPENIWLKVVFQREYTVPGGVDSDASDPSLSGGFFDPSGRAVVPQLRRGEPIVFQPNEIGVFSREYGDQLIQQGIANLIAPVFVRKLNDYQFEFHSIFERGQDVDEATKRAERDIAALERSRQYAQQQIAYRQQEKVKLETDLAGFQNEQQVVTQLVETLQQQKADVLAELSTLYKTNIALEQELAQLHQRLIDEIDSRSEAAAAGTESAGG